MTKGTSDNLFVFASPLLIKMITFLNLTACTLFQAKPTNPGNAPGPTLSYLCDLGLLNNSPQPVTLSFSWYPPSKSNPTTQRILVSDGKFENSPAAIVVIIDTTVQRIELAKTANGAPLETSMTAQYVDKNTSLQLYYLRIAEFVLSNAANHVKEVKSGAKVSNPINVGFLYESRTFKTAADKEVAAPFQFGKLPKTITSDKGEKVCEHK